MKKSKVTSLAPWDNATPDQYGNIPYNIEFEDGTKGSYRGNPAKLSFTVGEEAEYVAEKVTSKNGKEYTKVTKPKKEGFGGGGGKSWTPPKEKWEEVIRKARSNASFASRALKHKRDEDFCERVVKFITFEIPAEDVEKGSPDHSVLISRMSATKNVVSTIFGGSDDEFLRECLAESLYIQNGK